MFFNASLEGCRAQEPWITPVTRSFLEFARLARPRRPLAIQKVQWRDICFREHCPATPEPMSHLRMGGMHLRIMGGPHGNPHGSAIPGWVRHPETPGGGEGFHARRGLRAQPALEGNPLAMVPIGIDAPFRSHSVTYQPDPHNAHKQREGTPHVRRSCTITPIAHFVPILLLDMTTEPSPRPAKQKDELRSPCTTILSGGPRRGPPLGRPDQPTDWK
jgi:hypothetical protein